MFFWPWYLWKAQASYFVECLMSWIYLMFPHDLIQIIHFCGKTKRSNVAFFLIHNIMRHMMLICFWDQPDHLIKETVFYFIILVAVKNIRGLCSNMILFLLPNKAFFFPMTFQWVSTPELDFSASDSQSNQRNRKWYFWVNQKELELGLAEPGSI